MTRAAPATLLLATTNRDKIREIREVLEGVPVRLATLADHPPVPEPEETGETFAANARLKALYYDDAITTRTAEVSGRALTLGEDSGLEIDALGGDPGVHSARFLRPDATYPERFAEIARRLALVPHAPRTARFRCAVAVVERGRVVHEATGTVEGEILPAPRGTGGFGYDPVFWYPPFASTFADVAVKQKMQVAHRGQAFRALAVWLTSADFRGL